MYPIIKENKPLDFKKDMRSGVIVYRKKKKKDMRRPGKQSREGEEEAILSSVWKQQPINPSVKHLLTGAGLVGRAGGERFE